MSAAGLWSSATAWLVTAAAATLIATQSAGPARSVRLHGVGAASTLVDQGLLLPVGADASAFTVVPAPALRSVQNEAQATAAPWIDSNGWRFERGLRKASYAQLPAGSSALAAAEAFAFDVEAILNPAAADLPELEGMVRFLNAHETPRLPVSANIGVVDDGSDAMGELLNMLTRRNLLYRVLSRPDRTLPVNVQLGTADFPKEAASNPSEFAARVRAKLGDERRLVRLYGATTVIAHLTGDARRTRLYLIAYGRGRMQDELRVRLLGQYRPLSLAAYGASPDSKVSDVEHPDRATEFTVPAFSRICVVDLEKS
jgi:hypothetical protein